MMDELTADDRGVSPVIGVVLMIALVVILASVVTTAAIAFTDQLQPSANAGVTVDGTEVTVTQLGPNAESVACVGSDGSTTATASTVGATMSCNSGDSVVAVGGENAKNTTIRVSI